MGAGTEIHNQALCKESKLQDAIWSLLSEIKEPYRRGGGIIIEVRGDRGHQENMAHQIDKVPACFGAMFLESRKVEIEVFVQS